MINYQYNYMIKLINNYYSNLIILKLGVIN